jgi:hypothetical protein
MTSDDPLGPARGFFHAILISLVIWAIIACIVWC